MLATIGRIIWVPIAFMLSGLICAFVVLTIGLERMTHYMQDMRGFDDPDMTMRGGFELLESGLVLAQAITLVPAVLAVLIGEIARIRSVYYYVICGGLAAASAPLLARMSIAGPADVPAVAVWQVFATGGFIAGFVYWLLAGRKA
ncbi:MAG: hypothetical protein KKB37_13125 [Alphaproteobacteria bacterium]|nr:hypothetical protein [Alphaproteobacteria bacterium]